MSDLYSDCKSLMVGRKTNSKKNCSCLGNSNHQSPKTQKIAQCRRNIQDIEHSINALMSMKVSTLVERLRKMAHDREVLGSKPARAKYAFPYV